MAKLTVRSYVSIEIVIDAEDWDDAVDQAGDKISEALNGEDFEFDFFEDAIVYDENGEELETAE